MAQQPFAFPYPFSLFYSSRDGDKGDCSGEAAFYDGYLPKFVGTGHTGGRLHEKSIVTLD